VIGEESVEAARIDATARRETIDTVVFGRAPGAR
jgi:hypothetical protein